MRTASFEEIRSGKVTDVYFQRTLDILEALNVHKTVTADIKASSLPRAYEWAVAAGIDDALSILEGLEVDVEAVAEGTLFGPGDPVMQITGDYLEFGVLETALLGFLCQQSGVATKAARCKKAAAGRMVISFGARRMHPALAPIIERAAYEGGCDGVSVVLSAELLGIEPSGTMPHALVLMLGDVAEAVKQFDRIVDPGVRRVALVDTFCDEKLESLRAAEAIGDRLFGVRLDTPGSRRGSMVRILEEVRWELDLRGFDRVRLMVSGGVDEDEILEMNEYADGYGVGTAISNARTIDFALDIVEIEGKPITKRGKKSGKKQLLRCRDCFDTILVPCSYPESRLTCHCGGRRDELLRPVMKSGKLLTSAKPPGEVRQFVLGQLEKVGLQTEMIDDGKPKSA